MAFNDRKKVPRVPYSGIIKLGVMVKSCAVENILEKIQRNDNSGRVEFVKIKGDPKSEREWEVIRYTKSNDNVLIRVDANSTENLDWIKSKEKNYQTKDITFIPKRPFPTAVPWFVVDHLPDVKDVYGHRPTHLDMMCAANDIETIITGLYKNNRRDLITCVGDGLTARRMDGNGCWNEIPYCNCGYRQGLPAKTVKISELDIDNDKYVTVKTENNEEKDVWREVGTRKNDTVTLKELAPTCGPKVEFKILLYKTKGSVLQPYTIRTRNLKTYDYISNTLKMIKDGDEASKGLGFLMGIPLTLNIRIEKTHVIDDGKKIPKDDIVLTVDFDMSYGNPLQKRLEDIGYTEPVRHALPAANKVIDYVSKEVIAEVKVIKEESNAETVEPENKEEVDPKKFLG